MIEVYAEDAEGKQHVVGSLSRAMITGLRVQNLPDDDFNADWDGAKSMVVFDVRPFDAGPRWKRKGAIPRNLEHGMGPCPPSTVGRPVNPGDV